MAATTEIEQSLMTHQTIHEIVGEGFLEGKELFDEINRRFSRPNLWHELPTDGKHVSRLAVASSNGSSGDGSK